MRFLCSAYRYLPAYLPSYPSFSLIIFYFTPPLHPLYRFLSITISVPSLFCLYRSCCFSYTNSLHPSPSLLHYLYCCSFSSPFYFIYISLLDRPLSLTLSRRISSRRTNRTQSIHPLPHQAPLPCTSTPTLHSWSWPANPTTLHPYYVQSLSLPLLLCLCWYCCWYIFSCICGTCTPFYKP